MFGLIFIVAAVISVSSSKDILGFDNNNGFQHGTIESDKENLIESDLKDEVAALKEIVLKQGQEISGLKLKQEQEISSLKQEFFLLYKKTNEQDMLIYSQDKLISELENVVQKQNNKIAEMKFMVKRQGNRIIILKETVDNLCGRIKTVEMKQISLNRLDNENDTGLTDDNGTYKISGKKLPDVRIRNKGNNSVRTNIARKSRITARTNIAFSAYLDHILDHLTTGHLVKCNQVLVNAGNAYNTITGLFTVPQTGVYLLTFTINSHANHTWVRTYVKLVSNNRNIIDAVSILRVNGSDQMGGNTAIVKLSAGESVWLEIFGTPNGQLQSDGSYRYVSFSGVFLF